MNTTERNEMKEDHAMVQRDGFSVPLIGIPADSVLGECECCHEQFGISLLEWTGKQMLCRACNI